MRTRVGTEGSGAARYETFVVRLWVEGSQCRHGDVRHVQSAASLRFDNLQRAFDFVLTVLEGTKGRSPVSNATNDSGAD